MNKLFEIDDWFAVEKKDQHFATSGEKFLLYHNCTLDIEKTTKAKYGFWYYPGQQGKHLLYCPFCQTDIPKEISFLLEMIKK